MQRTVKGMRAFTSQQRREIRAFLILKYGTNCQICSKAINMNSERQNDSFSIDHIVPLADGGENDPANMHPTHIACNERKGSAKVPGYVRSDRSPRKSRNYGARLAYTSSS